MNKETISPHLTFEQFKAYADRQPDLDGNWIYRLTHIRMEPEATYPQFKTDSTESYFLTLSNAQAAIPRLVDADNATGQMTYCFLITQIKLGMDDCCNEGAEWLYDHTGKLADYTITTFEEDPYKSYFFGRSADRLRFKKGDIVEVRTRRDVHLAIVADEGPSVERCWRMYHDDSSDFYFRSDGSDDIYNVVDGPGYAFADHVFTLSLMKPRFPVPGDIKEFLNYSLEKAHSEEACTDRYRCQYMVIDHLDKLYSDCIAIMFDRTECRHKLMHRTYDEVTMELKFRPVAEDEKAKIEGWLAEIQYGRTRLWYLIRDWNTRYSYPPKEPVLDLDTPFDSLV